MSVLWQNILAGNSQGQYAGIDRQRDWLAESGIFILQFRWTYGKIFMEAFKIGWLYDGLSLEYGKVSSLSKGGLDLLIEGSPGGKPSRSLESLLKLA